MSVTYLSSSDSYFLANLRSISIFAIVFGHVGGFWLFKPYSELLNVFVPVFFFISGAVSWNSYEKNPNIKNYYLKRFIGLLVPYYLLCFISLFLFVALNKHLPQFDLGNLLMWAQLRPTSSISPFPVGQIWFLHTLLIIILISPVFFYLKKHCYPLIVLLMFVFIAISGIQHFVDIDDAFYLFGNNCYKPLVHSSFFIFGMICFGSSFFDNSVINLVFVCFLCVASILIALILNRKYSG